MPWIAPAERQTCRVCDIVARSAYFPGSSQTGLN